MGGDLLTPSKTSENILRKMGNWIHVGLSDEAWKHSDDCFTWTDVCYACGKRTTLQLTFSVVIFGARESHIKFASRVGTQSATRIVWISFLFMSQRKTRTV